MTLPLPIFTGQTVFDSVSTWLAAAAFFTAAAINAAGPAAIRATFVRLGFPVWWRWVTSALELVTAVLLVTDGTRMAGVGLGACIMLAAVAAILRARYYRELPPPLVFLALLALAGIGAHA